MYGWIETGIGVNRLFNDTKMMDVIFRTARFDNNIVIGNSSNVTAAIYVSSNNVGIHKLPDPRFTLDVAGTMCVQNEIVFLNATDPDGKIVLNNTNIELKRRDEQNIFFDTFGLFKGKVVMSDDVKSRKITLQNLIFRAIYPMRYVNAENQIVDGYRAELDIGYAEYIEQEDLLCINNRLYQVMNAFSFEDTGILAVEFDYYLTDQRSFPLDLHINTPYQVDVLIDLINTLNNTDYIYLPIFLQSFYYSDELYLHLNIQLLDLKNLSFLVQRGYYHIKNSKTRLAMKKAVQNIVMLESYYFLDEVNIQVTFRSVDGVTPIASMIGDLLDNYSPTTALPLYLFRLDTVSPRTITENEAYWGFYVISDGTKYISLKNTSLVDQTNTKTFENRVIDSIIFNDTQTYEVLSTYSQDGSVILNLSGLEYLEDFLYAEKGKVSYSYIANPMRIETARYLDDYTVEYIVTNYEGFLNDLVRFVNSYVYVIDKKRALWKIKKLVVTSVGSYIHLTSTSATSFSSDDAFLLQPRVVYLLPFKLQALTKLGDDTNNTYIQNSLGIGTSLLSEKLTVDGNIALKNQLRFEDLESPDYFYQVYRNSIFNFNNLFYLTPEYTLLKKDTYVDGIMTANDYMSVSDRRLKKNIRDASPYEDLNTLLKLNVKNFEFIDKKAFATANKKGVIAQEIQKVLPNIVHTNTGFIPNIYKKGLITTSFRIAILGNFTESINVGSILRFEKDNQAFEKEVMRAAYSEKNHKTLIHIKDPVRHTGKVFVYGVKSSYKTIDKDYLFMMTMNSIKALNDKIDSIKHLKGIKNIINK